MICACGCGTVFPDQGSKKRYRRYFPGHSGTNRIKSVPLTKICTKCKKELSSSFYNYRNIVSVAGIHYKQLRSQCKTCEDDYRIWHSRQINSAKRKRRSSFSNDLLLRIKDRGITHYKNKTPNSDLTTSYLCDLFTKQNGKCYYLGIDLKVATYRGEHSSICLDRVDPKKGYMQGNVVWASFLANSMKTNLTEEEFYIKMQEILIHKQKL